jgi:uncharacterized protein YdhG (YjbR/CyaY superfamily)
MPTDSVTDYLAALPEDRRAAVTAILDAIRNHLPEGYAEGMQYGMPSFFVPHSLYPYSYHCDPKQPVPFVGVASQKQHIGLYLFCIYVDAATQQRFVDGMTARGLKLDMGKGCVRFKKLDAIPLDLIGETVAAAPVKDFLAAYEAGLPTAVKKKRGLA